MCARTCACSRGCWTRWSTIWTARWRRGCWRWRAGAPGGDGGSGVARFRGLALLGGTRLTRPERIAVADEIRNTLAIVSRAMLPALAELYETWTRQFGDAADFGEVLTLGSWLG